MFTSGPLYSGAAYFTEEPHLQSVLRNFEIARVHFANFWLKPDPAHGPSPNANCSQIGQHILQMAQTSARCIHWEFV